MRYRRSGLAGAILVVAVQVLASGSPSFSTRLEENRGQFVAEVRFAARTDGALVLVGDDGIRIERPGARFGFSVVDALPVRPFGESPVGGVTSYFIGADPARWVRDARGFERVRHRGILPGVDLVVQSGGGPVEYLFDAAPGALERPLVLRFEGSLVVDLEGNLVERSGGDCLSHRRPVGTQTIHGVEHRVEVWWQVTSSHDAVLALGDHDPRYRLVIDPVLEYSTFYGGSSSDYAWDVAVDDGGNIVIVGSTYSHDLVLSNPFQSANMSSGERDVFIAKLNPSGDELVFATYLGGAGGRDIAEAVAVDSDGNVVVVGETHSVDFPVTPDAIQDEANWYVGDDGFLTKLSPQGDLLYSTYFAAESIHPSHEYIRDVAVDSSGAMYLVGDTTDPTIPTTGGAFRPTGCGGNSDAFVAKLSRSGSLEWSTYVCGSGHEWGSAIAVDAADNVVVAGVTSSSDFPQTEPSSPLNGSNDAWVTKLDPSGSALVYSHLVGGSDSESGKGVAVRRSGGVVVVGTTRSQDLPVLDAAQPTYGGGASGCVSGVCGDAFVAELDPEGHLVRSTYLGGRTDDSAQAVAIARNGVVVVAGATESSDLPNLDPVDGYGGWQDAFVVAYGPLGELRFATFLGGQYHDSATGVAVRGDLLYVAGKTASDDFPVVGAFQATKRPGDNSDAFLTVIRTDLAPPPRRLEGRLR